MRIALAQINTTVGDVKGNRDLVLATLEGARGSGADLVLFPELCLTGYPPRDVLGIHGFVEANLRALDEIAARVGEVGAVVGFVDRNTGATGKPHFNAAALLHRGKVAEIVHKTLLPTYDVFDEDRYFEPARSCRVVRFRERRIGLSICEDAWNDPDFWPQRLYPIDPIQRLVDGGAELLLNISASPFETAKPEFRYRMLLSHVRKHKVPLLYANLIGGNDDLIFDGNSLALGRRGNVLARGKSFAEDLVVVDPDAADDVGYREPEEMAKLFDALVLGTRDYARKCGFRSAVLGLSGGIDSAVTACIAAAAFGPEKVLGVALPSRYSVGMSQDDACRLARNLGIGFQVIPIESMFKAYEAALEPAFAGLPQNVAEENIQTRIRGTILMALSNKLGHLVLSTGTKSELGVGYCTLYGDMAGGLAVISDLPKTTVYRLAEYLNRDREVIPRSSIERPPTAELRPNQTDQDTLPPYEVLDPILELAVEQQMNADEIVARGHPRPVVEEVLRMVARSEYKRRQAAPGLKVTSRAFGFGRRMPIAQNYVQQAP